MASEFVELTSCASAGSFEHVHADTSIQQPSERDVDPWSGDSAVGVDSEFGAAGLSEFSDVIPDFDGKTNIIVDDLLSMSNCLVFLSQMFYKLHHSHYQW